MRLPKTPVRALVIPGALLLSASAIRAQPASTRQISAAPAPSSVDLNTVRQDLKAILTAQEKYFVSHNTYALDLAALEYTATEGVTVKFVEKGTRAYSVSGIVTGQTGASCVVMVGNVSAIPSTAKGAAAKAEGGVLCDGDPPTSARRG